MVKALLPKTKEIKVVLAHDWLLDRAGAERHFLAISQIWPQAPIYTSAYQKEKTFKEFKERQVVVGWPGRWPFLKNNHRLSLLARQIFWRQLNLSDYNLIISSSGSEAKAIRSRSHQLHINLCYAPTHYYFDYYQQYRRQPGLGAWSFLAKILLPLLRPPLAYLDRRAAQRPQLLLTNSKHSAKAIERHYGRQATVIYPPAIGSLPKLKKTKRNGYIVLGRHVPYKNFGLAIKVANQTKTSLTVLGFGPQTKLWQKMAGATIRFLGSVSEEEKWRQLGQAQGLIFCGIEDFGITAVESLAAGTPVIALAAGGVQEIVTDQVGLFFKQATSKDLREALVKFEKKQRGAKPFSPQACQKRAQQFSKEAFLANFSKTVEAAWRQFYDQKTNHRN